MGLLDRNEDNETLIDRERVAVVPLLAERLDIHKTLADAGGLRIHKRVHQETVTVDEPLLRQAVQVTRTPIGREITAPLPIRYEGDVTVIPVVEARLVTVRQLILVEEVRLTRIEQTERAPQSITLRREEAFVERQDMRTGQWLPDPASPPSTSASFDEVERGPESSAVPYPPATE